MTSQSGLIRRSLVELDDPGRVGRARGEMPRFPDFDEGHQNVEPVDSWSAALGAHQAVDLGKGGLVVGFGPDGLMFMGCRDGQAGVRVDEAHVDDALVVNDLSRCMRRSLDARRESRSGFRCVHRHRNCRVSRLPHPQVVRCGNRS